jgi:hypothetical protein
MRKKQRGGVIVLSKKMLASGLSMDEAINFFVQNSQISLLTKGGAEGIILNVQLNPGVESPFVKLSNIINPLDETKLKPVTRIIMKINLLNDVPLQSERILGRKENRITPFKKRTITKKSWKLNIEREKKAFKRTFDGVESLVPTIFHSSSYNKSNELDNVTIQQLFENVDNKLTFISSEVQLMPRTHTYKEVNVNYNLKEQLLKLLLRVQEIGICFYEIIDNAQTVWDFLNKEKQPLDQKYWVFSRIFAKMIQMLEKGVIHGDHHHSNIMVIPPGFVSSGFVQFIDFARCHFIEVPLHILEAIQIIKTSPDPLEISIATIKCLRFIYNEGYFDDTSNRVVVFDPSWDMYLYIKKTIYLTRDVLDERHITLADIKNTNLAVEVCKVIKEEEQKKEIVTQYFIDNVKLIQSEAQEQLDNADSETIISFIVDHAGLNKNDLEELSKDELMQMYKNIIDTNPELSQNLIDEHIKYIKTNWSPDFVEMCRIKIFESEQQPDQKVGGNSASAAGGGGPDDDDISYKSSDDEGSFGGSKKRRKTRKQHGGSASRKVSNEWIDQYYKMDFEKTQEQIYQHFAKHNYFAGIIIILIKLGIIGNNPPSIMLKTEKTKAIINNAVSYYQELDTILNGNQLPLKTKSKTLKTRSKSRSSRSLRPRSSMLRSKSMKNVGLAKAKQQQTPYTRDSVHRAPTRSLVPLL